VLLKPLKDIPKDCPDSAAMWTAIEMTLVEPGKLYGRWRQTHVDKDDMCTIVGHSWQLYGLERIRTE
jgi:hypothetical protein